MPIPAGLPPPAALKAEAELRREAAADVPEKFRATFERRTSPIDIRPLHPRSWLTPVRREPVNHSWFRCVAPLPDDPALHRAVLAYASDMALMATSMMPHGVSWTTPGMQSASLDHALWLHEPVRADRWLLYSTDSPWAGHARGMNRGSIYAQDGRLVATVAQEGLIRLRERT